MAGAIIGKGGHNIQKLRTEVCDKYILIHFFLTNQKKRVNFILIF